MQILLQIWKDRSGGPVTFGVISAIGTLFSIGSSLGIFGGKGKGGFPAPFPTVLAEEPAPAEPKVRDAQDRARRRRAVAVGRQGTILTSPLGLAGDESIARPSLLGR